MASTQRASDVALEVLVQHYGELALRQVAQVSLVLLTGGFEKLVIDVFARRNAVRKRRAQ